jgi:HSP20 family protein
MLSMRRSMDRLFDRALEPSWSDSGTWDLALDVVENKDEFLVKASLPGINPSDIEITFTDNVLTIQGEIKEDKEIKEEQYHLRERRQGMFSRSISLPNRVKSDAIEASYDAGVLSLRLPKVDEVKPKQIAIKVNGSKMIEGKSKDKK